MMLGMKSRFVLSAADWVAIILLAVAGWKYTYGLEQGVDISFVDPSFYLMNGVTLQEKGLPEAQDAPLYAIWFRLLSLTQPDRVELYYRDYKLLTILLPLMMYLMLRRCAVSSIAALVVSALGLISFFNFPSFTRVSHFATCVVLASLIGASLADRFRTATAIAALGALLASYARPELFLAWILLALMAVGCFIYDFGKDFRSRDLVPFAVFILINAAFLFFVGIPVAGGRSGVAFTEHFAVNWVGWTGSSLNPWLNAKKIYAASFGDAVGVPAAMWTNPALFFRHVASNVKTLPFYIGYLFSLHTRPLITGPLGLGILSCLLVVFGLGKSLHVRRNVRNNRRLLLYAMVYLLVLLVSVTVIYPRLHYLVLACALLIVVMASIFLVQENEGNEWSAGRIVLAGLVVVAVVPLQESFAMRENVETVRTIRSLGINDEVRLFHEGGVLQIYLGDNYRGYPVSWMAGSFDRFLLDRGINMVIVTDALRSNPKLTEDDGWLRFLDRYEKKGFVRVDVRDARRMILVRKELINKEYPEKL